MLLAETPGAYAYSDAGNGIGYSYLKIRGFPSRRIGVTINGIPLNDPESREVYWIDHPDLAASAQEIQVQRGVGASAYGTTSLGGLGQRRDDPVRAGPLPHARRGRGHVWHAALLGAGGLRLARQQVRGLDAPVAHPDRRLPRPVVVRSVVVLRRHRARRQDGRVAAQLLRRAGGDAPRVPRGLEGLPGWRGDRRPQEGPQVQPADLRERARSLLRAALRAAQRLEDVGEGLGLERAVLLPGQGLLRRVPRRTSTCASTTNPTCRARPTRPTSCAGAG